MGNITFLHYSCILIVFIPIFTNEPRDLNEILQTDWTPGPTGAIILHYTSKLSVGEKPILMTDSKLVSTLTQRQNHLSHGFGNLTPFQCQITDAVSVLYYITLLNQQSDVHIYFTTWMVNFGGEKGASQWCLPITEKKMIYMQLSI